MILKTIVKLDKFIDFILVVILVFSAYQSQTSGAECNAQRPDCGEASYCGLDLKCHKFPLSEIVEEEKRHESKQIITLPLVISLVLIGGTYFYYKNDKK